jgi:hypothetical protein
MTTPEETNKSADTTEVAELRERCASLTRQSNTLLLGLLVVSLTLTAYLGLQWRRSGNDLLAIRPQAAQVVEAAKKEEQGIKDFVAKLAEYGKTHPDFQPIINKYKITASAPTGGTNTPQTKSQ